MYYLVPREYIVHSSSKTGMGLCAINVQRIIGYGDDWNFVVSLFASCLFHTIKA